MTAAPKHTHNEIGFLEHAPEFCQDCGAPFNHRGDCRCVVPAQPFPLVDVIRQAVARGWCHPKNASKEMDADLAEAIIAEVVKAMTPKVTPGHK